MKRREQFLLFGLVLSLTFACAIIGGLFLPPVQAAGGGLEPCALVATTGKIDVYYCEPEYGPRFLVNSVGFMVLED